LKGCGLDPKQVWVIGSERFWRAPQRMESNLWISSQFSTVTVV